MPRKKDKGAATAPPARPATKASPPTLIITDHRKKGKPIKIPLVLKTEERLPKYLRDRASEVSEKKRNHLWYYITLRRFSVLREYAVKVGNFQIFWDTIKKLGPIEEVTNVEIRSEKVPISEKDRKKRETGTVPWTSVAFIYDHFESSDGKPNVTCLARADQISDWSQPHNIKKEYAGAYYDCEFYDHPDLKSVGMERKTEEEMRECIEYWIYSTDHWRTLSIHIRPFNKAVPTPPPALKIASPKSSLGSEQTPSHSVPERIATPPLWQTALYQDYPSDESDDSDQTYEVWDEEDEDEDEDDTEDYDDDEEDEEDISEVSEESDNLDSLPLSESEAESSAISESELSTSFAKVLARDVLVESIITVARSPSPSTTISRPLSPPAPQSATTTFASNRKSYKATVTSYQSDSDSDEVFSNTWTCPSLARNPLEPGPVRPGDSYHCPIEISDDSDDESFMGRRVKKESSMTPRPRIASTTHPLGANSGHPTTAEPPMCILRLRTPPPREAAREADASAPTSPRAVLEKCQPAVDALLKSTAAAPASASIDNSATASVRGLPGSWLSKEIIEATPSDDDDPVAGVLRPIKQKCQKHGRIPKKTETRLILSLRGMPEPIMDEIFLDLPSAEYLERFASFCPLVELLESEVMSFFVTKVMRHGDDLIPRPLVIGFHTELGYTPWRAQQTATSVKGFTVYVTLDIVSAASSDEADEGKGKTGAIASPSIDKVLPAVPTAKITAPVVVEQIVTPARASSTRSASPVTAQRYLEALLDNTTNTPASIRLLRILLDEKVDLDSTLGMDLLDLALALRKNGPLAPVAPPPAAEPAPTPILAPASPMAEERKTNKPTKAELMIQEVLNKLNDHSEMLNAIAQVVGVDLIESDEEKKVDNNVGSLTARAFGLNFVTDDNDDAYSTEAVLDGPEEEVAPPSNTGRLSFDPRSFDQYPPLPPLSFNDAPHQAVPPLNHGFAYQNGAANYLHSHAPAEVIPWPSYTDSPSLPAMPMHRLWAFDDPYLAICPPAPPFETTRPPAPSSEWAEKRGKIERLVEEHRQRMLKIDLEYLQKEARREEALKAFDDARRSCQTAEVLEEERRARNSAGVFIEHSRGGVLHAFDLPRAAPIVDTKKFAPAYPSFTAPPTASPQQDTCRVDDFWSGRPLPDCTSANQSARSGISLPGRSTLRRFGGAQLSPRDLAAQKLHREIVRSKVEDRLKSKLSTSSHTKIRKASSSMPNETTEATSSTQPKVPESRNSNLVGTEEERRAYSYFTPAHRTPTFTPFLEIDSGARSKWTGSRRPST